MTLAKTFLVEAIDFMLGAGSKLKDIPERVGYERVLLGLTARRAKTTPSIAVSTAAASGAIDGLLTDVPADQKAGKAFRRSTRRKITTTYLTGFCRRSGSTTNDILWSRKTGELRSLGFRALAHLCVIAYPKITQVTSPLYDGQYQDQTREYGVFKLLLTGNDDSAVTPESAIEAEPTQAANAAPSFPKPWNIWSRLTKTNSLN